MLTARLSRLGFLICVPLLAIDPTDWAAAKPSSEKEAFFLRRIADFWQEGEYGIAKSQMEEFLSSYPGSKYADLLRICLGDIFLREKQYSKALASYASLSSPEMAAKAFLNRMLCLYHLEWYSTLADECEGYLHAASDEELKLQAQYYLAISLYHQCLNASGDSELLIKLAQRAEPHFESLMKSELSFEAAQAFAHLSCILKEFPRAAALYLGLAESESEASEEMTFQAASIQAEFDRELALKTFRQIEEAGKKRAKDAAYNRLVLSFEMGLYGEIVEKADEILRAIPENRKGMARYYLGSSFLAEKKARDAALHLIAFLEEAPHAPSDSIRSGLLSLIEAGHESGDLAVLDRAIGKLFEFDPSDRQIPRGKLLRAMLMKREGKIGEARDEIESLMQTYVDFDEKAAALFEWADLEYAAGAWEECRARALAFIESYPNHELSAAAWRYLATASSHTGNQQRFVEDLEALLDHRECFSVQEANEWQFYLSQGYFNLRRFQEAIEMLRPLSQPDFAQEANAQLLLGLCYRDGMRDLGTFCHRAETALSLSTDLMEPKALRLALFNAYLELSKEAPELKEKCGEHLIQAFLAGAEMGKGNLLWLGDWCLSKKDLAGAERVYSRLLELEFDETASYELGKIYSQRQDTDRQIAEMERCIARYRDGGDWKWERETKLLLAEGYAATGRHPEALQLFDEITDEAPAGRSETIAKAYLQKALLSFADGAGIDQTASRLKDIVLQKRFESEPIHLEAALEYADLLGKSAPEKRIALLEKSKKDFEGQENLLAKDYHQARSKFPDKDRLFGQYMKWIEEEILNAKSELATDLEAQKELQAKAKDLLLQIKSECDHPALLKRVSSRLQNADVPVSD